MFRTFAAVSLAATALATTMAMAQPAESPARAPMTRAAVEQRAAAMFARMDADGDARLTPADRQQRAGQRADERFARLDTNSDGSLSREEFAASGPRRAERRAEAGAEVGAEQPRRARMGGMHGGPRQIMASADANGDGAVTQAELTSAMLARFDAADANRDGTISAEERRAHRRPDRPATR